VREHVRRRLVELWTRLFAYAFSLTRDRDQAADVLQQAALNALAAKCLPNREHAIKAWLFRIVRNAWIDICRHDAVRRREEVLHDIDLQPWAYDDRIIAEVTVAQGLAVIDPAHREIIALVDMHGFRYAEAAEILGVPEGTVMSRLSRARLALLDAIGGNVVAIESAKRRTSP